MADSESSKPTRRIIKKVESVRQLTEKGAKAVPKKRGVLRLSLHYIGLPLRPIGKVLLKIGRLKPFRFIGRILVPAYFRNSWKELRQVTWPTKRESWQLTGAVLIFAAVFGVMIAVVDYGFDKIFKQVLLK